MTNEIQRKIHNIEKDPHIVEWLSVLPMVLIVVLINRWNIDLSIAVLIGTALAIIIGRRNIENKIQTFNAGVASVGTASITTAVSVGFGGAVLACPGAQVILRAITSLPVNPIISLSIAASFAGLLTGNGGGGCDVAMSILSKSYVQWEFPLKFFIEL